MASLYFALYYGLFRFVIVRFDLKTPGREEQSTPPGHESRISDPAHSSDSALAYLHALGGRGNLVSIDACTTRLRLEVVDRSKVDAAQLKSLGARGLIWPAGNSLQVVVGTHADQLVRDIKQAAAAEQRAPATATADGERPLRCR